MVKVQLDLSETENKVVEALKIFKSLKDKKATIKMLIREKGEMICGDPNKYLKVLIKRDK